MDIALGDANEVAGLVTGDCQLHRIGVRKAHVFRGKADDPAGDVEGVFPGFEHAGQPVDGRVRVTVSHGFMQCRNQIIMLLPLLVSVTVVEPSGAMSPLVTTISRVDRALRASPLENTAIRSSMS